MSLALVLALASLSQSIPTTDAANPVDPNVTYAQKTVIDFPDAQVDGTVVKPAVGCVFGRQPGNFPPMIKVRRSFEDMTERSVDEVK